MILVAGLILGAVAASQDVPTVTIERTSSANSHLTEIQRATGGRIKLLLDGPGKEIPLQLKNASFFEALDAVCRTDGTLTYFGSTFAGPDGTIEVRADPWVPYPAVYSGPFRIMICELTRTNQVSSLGSRSWARVHMVLFAPPWIAVGRESGAKADFVPDEARDAAGNGLILPLEDREPTQRVSVGDYASVGTRSPSNSASHAVLLRSFDLDKGLSLFKGHIALTIADGVEASLAPKEGESVKTPAGLLVIDRVTEHLKTDQGITWRIQLSLKPDGGSLPLRALLENRVKQGEGAWRELDLPKNGMTFEAVIGPSPHLPASLIFRARKGVRPIDVPFEFHDLSFKKG